MRKRKLLLPLLLLAALLPADAQHVQLKVGGGIASHYADSRPVGAFKIGLGYEYELGLHWSFTPSLFFYGKGWKNPDQEVFIYDDEGALLRDEEGQPLKGVKNCTSTANYLTLPVLFNCYLRTGESRYVVLSAGPYVACGVSGKMKTKGDAERPGSEKFYYATETFDEEGAHRFDAGLQAAAGYQFPSGLSVGLEADFGLTRFNTHGERNVSCLVFLTYTFGK